MRFLFLILLVLGIFFRFTHLEQKVYWYDEAITSLRASGYTEEEVVQHFSQKSVVSVTELKQYQHPDGTKSFSDTVESLAKEDPQHPPLYYGLLDFWFSSIGSSPALSRLLPALLSLLAFPSAYWLCQELFIETGVFASRLPTYLMMGLMAVSPFHLLYAQESREYSLWVATTLLSTAALLGAIRLNTRMSWGIYILTVVLNLYTFPLGGLTVVVHGFYVLLVHGFHHRKTFKKYIISSSLSAIFFLPYVLILIINRHQAKTGLNWIFNSRTHSELIDIWIQNFGRLFFDVNQDPWDFYGHRVLLVLFIYAFYYLCSQAPRSVWLMIVLLTATSTLPLMMPDWIFRKTLSITAKYMIPGFLGVQLAITYLLGKHLASPALKFWHHKFWQLLLVILLSGSILSCAVSAQATIWNHKDLNQENIAVAKIVNQTTHPLLISDTDVGHLLSLSHSLKPTVQILLRPRCYTCQIQSSSIFGVQLPTVEKFDRFSDVFLFRYRSDTEFLQELLKQKNYKFEPVVFRFAGRSKNRPVLWRVIPIRTETKIRYKMG